MDRERNQDLTCDFIGIGNLLQLKKLHLPIQSVPSPKLLVLENCLEYWQIKGFAWGHIAGMQ